MREVLPLTPYKQLEGAPPPPSESSDGSKKKRGMNIDDDIKLAFLHAWISWSQVPFAFCISENKTKARQSIENIIK